MDHDATEITEIVLPLLNVNRRTKARVVNPNEVLRFILKRTMLFDLNKLYVININKEEEIGVTKIILHETAIKDL